MRGSSDLTEQHLPPSRVSWRRFQRANGRAFILRRAAPMLEIADNDRVRIFNDLGAFECLVKVAPSAQPGQVIIDHAWENFQFARHKGQQEPIVGSWKALHLVGDYGQLHYRALYGAPTFGPRGVHVEVQKV